MAVAIARGEDLLRGWAGGRAVTGGARCSITVGTVDGGLRFAFYGRMSTDDFQDRATSRRWQRDVAVDLVAGQGRIVVEFFDVGCSRRRSWRGRPRAAALLAAIAGPDRGFDAIVVGEYERAFAGRQCWPASPPLRSPRRGVLLNGSAPVLCLGGDYARSSFVGAQVKAVTSIRRRACELVMCGTGRRL